MASWIPPISVGHQIIVAGDNDTNYTGQKAAYTLANELSVRRGLSVTVEIPPTVGQDWNDFCIEEDYLIKEREGIKMY